MKHVFFGGLLAAGLCSPVAAQFHAKSKTGSTEVNEAAVNTAVQQHQNFVAQGANSQVGANENSTIYVSDAHRKNYGARMGRQDSKNVEVWGRAIHHSDGTYTESKQDLLTNTLEQITKSKNGTKLQRRMVMLDETGRATEVMIYDGRDKFKYRGVQLYDTLGRFAEEQLYDSAGTLIRRKVQEYDPRGQKLPLRSWDYVANIPADLKLVITRENEDPTSSAPGNADPQKPERRNIFSGAKKQQQAAPVDAGSAPTQGTSPAPGKRKGLNLGRLFGGKREK